MVQKELFSGICLVSFRVPGDFVTEMDKVIGLLLLTITWYKIRHAGGQAHYYSPTETLKQSQVKLDWFGSLCFNVPVGE